MIAANSSILGLCKNKLVTKSAQKGGGLSYEEISLLPLKVINMPDS